MATEKLEYAYYFANAPRIGNYMRFLLFEVHRAMMAVCTVMVVAGFVLIWVELKGLAKVMLYELNHDKTCFIPYPITKEAGQHGHPRSMIGALPRWYATNKFYISRDKTKPTE